MSRTTGINLNSPLCDIRCASLPPESLGALAEIRDRAGVTVAVAKGRTWVYFPSGDEAVLRQVLPVSGVILYVRRDGRWYQQGCHLPDFDFPEEVDHRPLAQALTPAPVVPMPPQLLSLQPTLLTLAPDPCSHPSTALRCAPDALSRWADLVPTTRLTSLQAARSGDLVLLLGTRLPPLPGGQRFWGRGVLTPLGYRPDPNLPPDALREALRVTAGELLLLDTLGAEVIPMAAFRPLTRAQVRLATGEAAP